MSADIRLYTDNLLDTKEIHHRLMQNTKWKFDGASGRPDEIFRHWCNYDYTIENNSDIKTVWEHVQSQIPVKLTPQRTILNVYNHGDTSYTHIDAPKWTIIVYMNPVWEMDWGGYTVFTNRLMEKIIYAAYPLPGSFIMFRGSIMHRPTAVERNALVPRMGLTFQCEESEE